MLGVWRNPQKQSFRRPDTALAAETPFHQYPIKQTPFSSFPKAEMSPSLSSATGSPKMPLPTTNALPANATTMPPMCPPRLSPLQHASTLTVCSMPATALPPAPTQPPATMPCALCCQLHRAFTWRLLQGDGEAETKGVPNQIQMHSGIMEAGLYESGLSLLRLRSATCHPSSKKPAGQQFSGRLPHARLLAIVIPSVHAVREQRGQLVLCPV